MAPVSGQSPGACLQGIWDPGRDRTLQDMASLGLRSRSWPGSRFVPLDRRQVRICLGALWLLDAGLQAQPALFKGGWWRNTLAESVMGQPSSIYHSMYWAIDHIAAHAAVLNGAFVAVQAAIGLALLTGRFERAAIVASVPWALGVWWVGEGFGTLPTGFALLAAGSPGPVLYYPFLGLLAWPRGRRPPFEGGGGDGGDRPRPAISPRAALGAWVVLWAGQALLHLPWAYPPGQVISSNVEEYSLGQPAGLLTIAHHVEALALSHPVALPAALGAVEVAVGVGVLLGRRARTAALAAGIGLSLLFWVVVQYFGTIPGGGASDPSAAPLLILLALALWPPPGGEVRPAPPALSDHRSSCPPRHRAGG